MSLCRSNTVLIIIALREFSPSTALALLILLLQDCLGYSGCLSVLCKFYYQLFSFDKGVLVGIVWICKAICGVLLLQVLKWSDCGCGIFSHVFKSSVIASMFCAFQSISFVLLILYSCWYCCEWIIVLISFFFNYSVQMYRKAILLCVGLIFCNICEIISFNSMLLGMGYLYIRSYHPLIEISYFLIWMDAFCFFFLPNTLV